LSDGILDPVHHQVVALDANGTPIYFISSDLCLFSPAFYDSVMRELPEATGIDPTHVLWSVPHSHSAPEIGPSGSSRGGQRRNAQLGDERLEPEAQR